MMKKLLFASLFLAHGVFAQHVAHEIQEEITIDGLPNEAFWSNADWRDIKYLFVDNVSGNQNTLPQSEDFSGRYKIGWKGNQLYILAEIVDDMLYYYPYDHNRNPTQVFNYDNLEIFLDEDKSGGAHTKTHNAFAFHISPNGNVADQCGCGAAGDYIGNSADWNGRLFNDVVRSVWTKDGNTYTWEVEVTVYKDTYKDGAQDNSASLAELYPGKVMGFGVAYNDYDGIYNGNEPRRDHMLGDFYIPGNNNGSYGVQGGRNVGWQDASVFGELTLDVITSARRPEAAAPSMYLDPSARSLVLNSVETSWVKIYSTTGTLIRSYEVVDKRLPLHEIGNGLYLVVSEHETIRILLED